MSIYKVDGIEFNNKKEYREYMINNYYSFKNKFNIIDSLIKYPGDINGQSFDISNCENCTIILMDFTDQIQIDHIKRCKVFIGSCATSLYIRNCEQCIFYICTNQLRIRESTNCIFYSYSQSQIHIELSNKLSFGPFLGGYKEQLNHLQSSNLNINNNLWYDIYDHNDIEKSRKNWNILHVNDYSDEWFPDGSNINYIPSINKSNDNNINSYQDNNHNNNQVGESFGIEQMINDNQLITNQLDYINDEMALLIVIAETQHIDLLSYFTSNHTITSNNKVSFNHFTNHIKELANILSKDNDESVKEELNVATSNESISNINKLCINDQIDVNEFISLCHEKYQLITGNMDDAIADNTLDNDTSLLSIPRYNITNDNRYSNIDESDAREYIQDIQRVSELGDRPFTAPGKQRSLQEGFYTINNGIGPLDIDTTQIDVNFHSNHLIDSPYDEQVVITDINSDIETVDYQTILPKPSKELSSEIRLQSSNNSYKSPNKRSNSVSRKRSNSLSNSGVNSKVTNKTVDYVINLIVNTIRQTDLYHIINVHLGFIASYTLIPARGEIIQSKPRPYLTIKDIQTAFQASRLHLTDVQVTVLFNEVTKFYNEVLNKSNKLNDEVIVDGPLVNANILKKYFTCLRLKKSNTTTRSRSLSVGNLAKLSNNKLDSKIDSKLTTKVDDKIGDFIDSQLEFKVDSKVDSRTDLPIDWNKWLNNKKQQSIQKKLHDIPNEFNELLNGKSNKLTTNEINDMIDKHLSISNDLLDKEITNRINYWINDLDGRRDFKHQLNVNLKKYMRSNKLSKNQLTKHLINEIKLKLIANKRNELLNQELKSKVLTKELFFKYLSNQSMTSTNWIQWLTDYITKSNNKIDSKVDSNLDNKINSYIPMNELMNLFSNVKKSSSIPIDNSIEINKRLVQLRKNVISSNNINDYKTIINIKSIDNNITNAISPFYTLLPNELKELIKYTNIKSNQLVKSLSSHNNNHLIYHNKNDAAMKAIEIENNKINNNLTDFNRWCNQKKYQQLQQIQKQEELKAKEEKSKQDKLLRGKEAYNKWLKRNKKNKYYSKIDNSLRPLPTARVVEHRTGWRQENDLTNHYAKVDRTM